PLGDDVLFVALCTLPVVIVITVCLQLSYPVYTLIRGMEWTRTEMIRRTLAIRVCPLLAILFFLATLDALASQSLGMALHWVFMIVLTIVALRLRAVSGASIPQPVETGELRNRVFSFAQAAGVKITQVYVLATIKTRIANAFAI